MRERVWKGREGEAQEEKIEMEGWGGGGEDIRKKVQRVGIETLCSSALFIFAVELIEQ